MSNFGGIVVGTFATPFSSRPMLKLYPAFLRHMALPKQTL